MADYQSQIAKDRHEFANIARVKLQEVSRHDASGLANVERVVDLLGEWMVRLSNADEEVPLLVINSVSRSS